MRNIRSKIEAIQRIRSCRSGQGERRLDLEDSEDSEALRGIDEVVSSMRGVIVLNNRSIRL